MKKIINLLAIITISFCNAQIVPLHGENPNYFNGTYNKDVDNDFNKFEGVWTCNQGNRIITVKFQKKYYVHYVDERWNYFQDILTGEYRILENGTQLINTLSNYDIVPEIDVWDHNIVGTNIIGVGSTPIVNGSPNERGVCLIINDPNVNYVGGEIVLNYFIENGIEKIKARIYQSGVSVEPYENSPGMAMKFQIYIFIKVP